ncbi:hypothetical protein DL93DRAFT_936718 [Clavulina sp. PMI_390]|nr:hypothetical protein DL93DRAFT_936718 [Clavulina sp. PMI_390]
MLIRFKVWSCTMLHSIHFILLSCGLISCLACPPCWSTPAEVALTQSLEFRVPKYPRDVTIRIPHFAAALNFPHRNNTLHPRHSSSLTTSRLPAGPLHGFMNIH